MLRLADARWAAVWLGVHRTRAIDRTWHLGRRQVSGASQREHEGRGAVRGLPAVLLAPRRRDERPEHKVPDTLDHRHRRAAVGAFLPEILFAATKKFLSKTMSKNFFFPESSGQKLSSSAQTCLRSPRHQLGIRRALESLFDPSRARADLAGPAVTGSPIQQLELNVVGSADPPTDLRGLTRRCMHQLLRT